MAVGALALIVVVIALIVLTGGGGGTYHLVFAEAGQLVRGDQVQVGGVGVGSVTNIELTPDFKARVTIHVEGSLTPLHEGTIAEVRVPSLSSVANRYIALQPGPNSNPALPEGATLPASATKPVTDLDELFNTLNLKTRRGLAQFLQGTAEQYAGAGRALGESTEYFAPALTATDHLFSELIRDQPVFRSFLVESAKAVTTIGARSEQLTDLIENANKTFTAVGSQQAQLAQGLRQLPGTLQQGNHTFAELPATFGALKQFTDASKPTVGPLTTLLQKLRSLVTVATPAVHNFSLAFNRPGPNNDLTDLARDLPALAKALSTASPSSVTALREGVPITALFGPYSPDLAGTLSTFGGAGAYYDANGHYARISPVFPSFTVGEKNQLTPASSPQEGLKNLKTGQTRRCPGAAQPASDGSSPFTDNGQLSCDPSEVP